MMRHALVILAIILTTGMSGDLALAQNPAATPETGTSSTGTARRAQKKSVIGKEANDSHSAQDALANESKKAIIETGISEPYFKEHFRLVRVVDEAGDRRVEWKYSINEYETVLVDDIGFYTSPAGERIDVHAIKNELFSAYDIKRTIPRHRAEEILKSCLGKNSDVMVVYRALKAPGKAGLYLMARSVEVPEKEKDEQEGEIEGISFNVAFVDLENGKCTIERGQVTP